MINYTEQQKVGISNWPNVQGNEYVYEEFICIPWGFVYLFASKGPHQEAEET
jgi:hypothetical protein